jgi:hypothetical protein
LEKAQGRVETVEQGAITSVWCAVSPQLNGKGGVYWETTVRLKEGKRRVQDGPLLPTPAGFIILRPLRDTLRPQIFYTERR